MSNILIVSNRLPVSVKKEDGSLVFSRSLGGLATGLASFVEDGSSIWVGWPGIPREELTEQDMQEITIELAKQQCAPVFLTKKQINAFYNGYSNSLLWPVFHDLPVEESVIPAQWWKAYREVNKLFADATLSLARPESTIWVHDYQLMLMPEMLKREHQSGQIGFFLHIPFPPAEDFAAIKESKQLLKGVLGADLAGFHTTGYSQNFINTCQTLIGVEAEGDILTHGDHRVQVSNFPIGVDYKKYAQAGKLKSVRQAARQFKKQYGKRKIIVAVDRLEPSKGLDERLRAYELLLKTDTSVRNNVVMVMVAAPSRMEIAAYQNLKKTLEHHAKRINTTYGTATWQPLDLKIEPLPFEQVNALYRIADVAFIAPLRDGMNLVAKEYVATRKKTGVLVLSETAGAAEELRDALLVNPLQPKAVADTLKQALTLPKRELKQRLKDMQAVTASNTIHTWAGSFVESLQKPIPGTRPITRTLTTRLKKPLLAEYAEANKRSFLLDYDGSLVPLRSNYKAAKPSKKVLQLLADLQSDPDNTVVVVSGRSPADLENWLADLNITLIAEHGAMIKKPGKPWKSQTARETRWKRVIIRELEKYTALTPGARIEEKPHSLVWHYRSASPYYAQKYAVVIKKVLKPLLRTYGIELYQGNKILEIKDPRVSKGAAIEPWLNDTYEFICTVGDDFTDEDMFKVAPQHAYSIKIGRGRTFAKYRLQDSQDLQKLLGSLTKQAVGKLDTHASPAPQPATSQS